MAARSRVPNLGDEAVAGGHRQELLAVRRGNHLLTVTAFFEAGRGGRVTGPRLTRDQLIVLAKEVLARA